MSEVLTERDDEAIVAALLNGKTLRQVRREFSLSEAEIDRALERVWPLDNAARLRMVRLDCGKLDRLVDEFSRRALAEDGQTSASYAAVALKALERKHDLTGANSAQRIDLQILGQPEAQRAEGIDRIEAAIRRIARGGDNGAPSALPSADDVGALSDENGSEPESFDP